METIKKIQPADKILNLPKYVFAQLAELKQEAIERGVDVIDISIGNPDGATPNQLWMSQLSLFKIQLIMVILIFVENWNLDKQLHLG